MLCDVVISNCLLQMTSDVEEVEDNEEQVVRRASGNVTSGTLLDPFYNMLDEETSDAVSPHPPCVDMFKSSYLITCRIQRGQRNLTSHPVRRTTPFRRTHRLSLQDPKGHQACQGIQSRLSSHQLNQIYRPRYLILQLLSLDNLIINLLFSKRILCFSIALVKDWKIQICHH